MRQSNFGMGGQIPIGHIDTTPCLTGMKSSAWKWICASLLHLEMAVLIVTVSKEQVRSSMHQHDEFLQDAFREDREATQLANDILTRLSRNDAAREKQFNSAELAPASITDLLSTVREGIQPLKGSMATLLQPRP